MAIKSETDITITIDSPTKLNRFLRIIQRRDDGYHEIQSIFQLIDWSDQLTFRRLQHSKDIRIIGMEALEPKDNLIYRAAKLLQTSANINQGAEIEVLKQIPMGAGLGGGSSNAACTLLALNQLWQAKQPTQKLAELGITLGADVPFFLGDPNAWIEGIGDNITPISIENKEIFLLIFPDCPVNTRDAFQHPNLKRNQSKLTTPLPHSTINPLDYRENTFTDLVKGLFPAISQCFEQLKEKYPDLTPQLTGTGGTIFIALPEKSILLARTIAEELATLWPNYSVKLARPLSKIDISTKSAF